MKKPFLRGKISTGILVFLITTMAQAGITDTPTPKTGPKIIKKAPVVQAPKYKPVHRNPKSGIQPGYTVGGTVRGLAGGTVILQINGTNATPIRVNGNFTFPVPIVQGKGYAVTVKTHPQNQVCRIVRGSGVMNKVKVTHVDVSCSGMNLQAAAAPIRPQADVAGNNKPVKVVAELSPLSQSNTSDSAAGAQQKGQDNAGVEDAMTPENNVVGGPGGPGGPSVAVAQSIPSAQDNSDKAMAQSQPVEHASTISDIDAIDNVAEPAVSKGSQQDHDAMNMEHAATGLMHLAQNSVDERAIQVQSEEQSASGLSGVSVSDATKGGSVADSSLGSNTTLTTSIRNLALSVTGHTEYGLNGTPKSGIARVITITNRGDVGAENLAVTSPEWPLNTTSSTTCGSTLAAGAQCTITVTPGNTATTDGTNACSKGTTPVPGVIKVAADNAEPISINTVVLNYGCIYQGGYVYAFDDTTANTKSVGGKVVAMVDQTPADSSGVSWSANKAKADDDWIVVDDISAQAACDTETDGACDTDYIHVQHQHHESEAPMNRPDYAAGYCQRSIGGYDDWYLPAICEMGYDSNACGDAVAPKLQNMQSNLVDFNNLNLLVGTYWSSTENLNYPYDYAWRQNFASDGDSSQFLIYKDVSLNVRCSRALTS